MKILLMAVIYPFPYSLPGNIRPQSKCKALGCSKPPIVANGFCQQCALDYVMKGRGILLDKKPKMSAKYPAYYKDVSKLEEIDVYAVHHLFNVVDPSGALQHASKKILLSGVRTGNKTKEQDIKEARDTLNRWLAINAPQLV